HFGHRVRVDQPDVSPDGARQRSTDASDDVRTVEHSAVLPERGGVPAAGLPGLDARDRCRGPFHLCGTRVQEPAAQEHRLRRDCWRPRVSLRVLDHCDDRGHRAVQTHAVNVDERDRETRERLIESATRLFAERGFGKVTVREICKAARANVAAVNYHFGGKTGLYDEVVQSAIRTMHGTTQDIEKAGE